MKRRRVYGHIDRALIKDALILDAKIRSEGNYMDLAQLESLMLEMTDMEYTYFMRKVKERVNAVS